MKEKNTVLFYAIILLVSVASISSFAYASIGMESDIEIFNQRHFFDGGGRVAGVSIDIATVRISPEMNGAEEYRFGVYDDMTALDALMEMSQQHGFEVRTQTFDLGTYVDGISEFSSGQDNQYWMFYVNGEFALESADNIIVQGDDLIEFKFEESIY